MAVSAGVTRVVDLCAAPGSWSQVGHAGTGLRPYQIQLMSTSHRHVYIRHDLA